MLFYFSDIDDCQTNPCLNDGKCVDGVNSYTCDCTHGFTGINCEISTKSCFYILIIDCSKNHSNIERSIFFNIF